MYLTYIWTECPLRKKVARLEVENTNLVAMIATISSLPAEERYPSLFGPTPTQNQQFSIKLLA